MNNLTFRMYADIRFNKPLNLEKMFIATGSYSMVMAEKTVDFDFLEYAGNIDEKDPCLLHIETRNPDFETFKDLDGVTKEMLQDITAIPEFYIQVDVDEDGDRPSEAKLESLTFVLPYENWENIEVKKDVLVQAKVIVMSPFVPFQYSFKTPHEIVEELLSLPMGTSVDFTFDTPEDVTDESFEPSGWYGIKRVELMDEPFGVLCFGTYGGGCTRIEEIYEMKEIEEIFQRFLEEEIEAPVTKLCVSRKYNGM